MLSLDVEPNLNTPVSRLEIRCTRSYLLSVNFEQKARIFFKCQLVRLRSAEIEEIMANGAPLYGWGEPIGASLEP